MNFKKIIITRPEPFASQLAAKLNAVGFANVVCLPCIEIEALPFSQADVEKKDEIDILIFISRNAAIYGHHLITTEKIAAIGLGTKTELERYQKTVDIFPRQAPFNSETLLARPELLQVNYKKIAIIRGGEGRGLLFDTLMARGAIVKYIDVYIRKKPHYSHKTLQHIFNDTEHSLAICTSEELLQNLCDLAKIAEIDLSRLQLCVISARMAEYARKVGFTQPTIIANSPGDKDIVWIIQSIKNQNADV